MSARRRPIVLADEAQDDPHSIALYALLNWGEEQALRYHAAIAEMLNSLPGSQNWAGARTTSLAA